MALIVFLRGVNVGGHKTFRPSILASELKQYDVTNVGAAGTFVVRKPGSQAQLQAEFANRLPFDTRVMICNARDLAAIVARDPFAEVPAQSGTVRFMSVLARRPRVLPAIPINLPPEGRSLVTILSVENRFVFGVYRRDMKTIRYLMNLDKIFGVPVTVRNWNTIGAILRVLERF